MKLQLYKSENRGKSDFGWLKANYSFSFANYYNPSNIHFGALRVLNDDYIDGGMGFSTHPHDNMEIITIPLEGSLKHRDSAGNEGLIKAGDIQVMSAGSGIQHSEHNGEMHDTTNVLQLWIFPNQRDVEPRYEDRSFPIREAKNQRILIVSDDGRDGSVWVHQRAYLSLCKFDKGQKLDYQLYHPENGVYLFNIEGSLQIGDQTVGKRDALGISETDKVDIEFLEDSYTLLIEVPMR